MTLRNHLHEKGAWDARDVPGAPWDPKDPLGTALGPLGTPLGPLGTPLGLPGTPLGPPMDPPGKPLGTWGNSRDSLLTTKTVIS